MSTQVAEFKPFEANLAEYKSRYEGVVYDMTDKKQEKQARSDRHAIGKVVAELDRTHAAVKAPLLEKVRLLDGERKRIKDDLQAVQGGIKRQIEEHEARLQAIEDALIARVDEIRELAEFENHPDSALIQERINKLSEITVDDSFSHYEAKAAEAHIQAAATLAALYTKAKKAEEEAAELARLRAEAEARERADRERRIAEEAAEKARREEQEKAERERQQREEHERIQREEQDRAVREAQEAAALAEKRRQEAEERAERERVEAQHRQEEAERKAVERAEREQREREDRERAEQEKREANKRHAAKINRAAVAALVKESGLSEDQAKAVVSAIAKRLIPAVSIAY